MRFLLFPFFLIYALITYLRNILFDLNLLPSKKFNLPVISIGNLCVAGTGKTPHTDYLISILKNYNVAVLSRGYGRNSTGFIILDKSSNYEEVGDEPVQLKIKYPNCIIAVSKSRKLGITLILKKYPNIDVIILDDAFQHRWIQPGLNILITTYQNPFYNNTLLPIGTLRESTAGKKRANMILISKTPRNSSLTEKNKLKNRLGLSSNQDYFFSYLKYLKWIPLFDNIQNYQQKYVESVTLVTGIANSKLLKKMLREKDYTINHIKYPDHYRFTKTDVTHILNVFKSNKSTKKVILTTEKDSVRLIKFKAQFKRAPVYFIPVEIMFEKEKEFNTQIINYVERNKRNR